MITSGTVLIENKIFNSKKGTIKVAVSKLWLVYCVSSMQMHEQILESGLRVEGDKSRRIYILEYNISNSMSFITRYLEYETLHHCFRHISDEFICHVFDNVEDTKKIYFPTQKHIYHSCTLEKMYQHSFSENSVHFSECLELIHLNLLELLTLSYSKYK